MEPLNFDGIKVILGPCSFVGQKDFNGNIDENTCFGITIKTIGTENPKRCERRLRKERQKELTHSLDELVRLASAYEENDEDENPASLAEAFFINLENFISLQHCCYHKRRPEDAVAKWQEQVNGAYHDQKQSQEQSQEHDEDSEEDDDDTASAVLSSPDISLFGDTPRHSRTVTPSTTPQTGRVIHLTTSAKSTHSAKSDTTLAPVLLDDDDPTPPATPTPGERLVCSTSGTQLRSSSGTASGTRLSFGQKKPQKQQPSKPARPLIQDEKRESLVNVSVSAANDPFSDAITADRSDRLEATDEDILAIPQLLKATTPLHSVDMHAISRDNGFQNYKDCYIGTDYLHIIETMQSGYAHYTRGPGRLYVLRDPHRSGLFKIGFSEEKKIQKRWQATPCTKVAVQGKREPVFVSEAMFPGAQKAEALVKASLRHRMKTTWCTLCNKYHQEWFWVEENVILAWVHAWTAYVQSDIFNAPGYPTMAYHEFANRLLRITPERIHKQLNAMPSPEPEPHTDPEETVANSATANVHGGSGSGSGSDGNCTKEAPLQPKPAPMAAAATSIQHFVRRAVTWDSGNISSSSSSSKLVEKKGKESTVVVQEVGELEDPDGMNGRRRNLQHIKKAPQLASQVTSQIQLGISGMVKWRSRSSKRS